MAGNYYNGSSVWTSLSNIFGNPTSGNTAESKPVASSFVSTFEGYMKKEIFGIPIWIIIVVAIVAIVIAYMVMS